MALADELPVLTVCRGIQVLNVALGGSLYQDLPSERPGAVLHDQARAEPPVPRIRPSHAVTVLAGTQLGAIVGEGEHRVNSMHHQGLERLAPGLVAVAHAPDGLVEGVEGVEADESRSSGFLLGVQWHPEELALGGDAASRRLFEAFVTAVVKRARR